MNERKLVLYISMSLDGYLATKEDDLSWLSVVEKEGEDYGYTAFNETVDTYIVGRTTYTKVLELTGGVFAQAQKHECFVMTRQEREAKDGVQFYNGDIKELVDCLKSKPGKNIYCDGGAEIVKLLMNEDLIDEYRISIIPIILGDGKRLFKGGTAMLNIELLDCVRYDSGLVQVSYRRKV